MNASPGRIYTMPRVMLDISRLLSRAAEAVPTGIDRVELAYAEYLIGQVPDATEFVALHPLGRFGTLPFEAAARFIGLLSTRWAGAGGDGGYATRAGRWLLHGMMLPGAERRYEAKSVPERNAAYLLLSHHHLTRPAIISETLVRRRVGAFVPMVHDLIPSDYPEYARPREPAKHLLRIETVARYADGVLVPTETVRQSLIPHFEIAGRPYVPIRVVSHGVHLRPPLLGPHAPAHPYFVCLGTIEPRKNHLLLLNLWRRLVEKHGTRAPKLILIGKRGWENENVIDMIERCPALQGVVEEHNQLPDDEVTRLLTGARALLFPSFAEGYGLPLAEALALGAPVICSDIAVFREVGGDVPVYLDPLDGLGWLHMVEAFAGPGAAARESQRARLASRPEPSWRDSVREGLAFIAELAQGAEPMASPDRTMRSSTVRPG
ncbi:glycosyltransferase family 4 protein [Acidisoma cladoniae]|jgi:glycosyltransferase involved in cell wall biosynthesis|uniref:glycosyltransferase family 4 protein n=1 Tax=Acidisoma cladoniae TaxID=3040935 RepID=UPI002551936A|nr:glycosyltransferase family 1 protein [Acidisoma sp. PAMC 29798]